METPPRGRTDEQVYEKELEACGKERGMCSKRELECLWPLVLEGQVLAGPSWDWIPWCSQGDPRPGEFFALAVGEMEQRVQTRENH